MTENKRTEAAHAHDDHELIEEMEAGPSQSGVSGGNLQREIAARGMPDQVRHDDKAASPSEAPPKDCSPASPSPPPA